MTEGDHLNGEDREEDLQGLFTTGGQYRLVEYAETSKSEEKDPEYGSCSNSPAKEEVSLSNAISQRNDYSSKALWRAKV